MEKIKKQKYASRVRYHSSMLLAGLPLLLQELDWLKCDKNIQRQEIEIIEKQLILYRTLLNKYFEN